MKNYRSFIFGWNRNCLISNCFRLVGLGSSRDHLLKCSNNYYVFGLSIFLLYLPLIFRWWGFALSYFSLFVEDWMFSSSIFHFCFLEFLAFGVVSFEKFLKIRKGIVALHLSCLACCFESFHCDALLKSHDYSNSTFDNSHPIFFLLVINLISLMKLQFGVSSFPYGLN